MTNIKTLGELKKSGYTSRSTKDELRENLIKKLTNKETVFEGIWGYEETVIPDLERAILAGHDINLLGLRGQAKTRLARLSRRWAGTGFMRAMLGDFAPIVKWWNCCRAFRLDSQTRLAKRSGMMLNIVIHLRRESKLSKTGT